MGRFRQDQPPPRKKRLLQQAYRKDDLLQKLTLDIKSNLKRGNSLKVATLIMSVKDKESLKKLEKFYNERWVLSGLKLNNYKLREDIQVYLSGPSDKATVKIILDYLNRKNPKPIPLTQKQIADTILTPLQRINAIKSVQLKGGAYFHIKFRDLAEWIFDDKNWEILCDPNLDNPKYRHEMGLTGNQAYISIFEKPTSTELRTWTADSSINYIRNTATRIGNHINWFYKDIGWISRYTSLHVGGSTTVLAGLKTKIIKYRKSWQKIALKSNKVNLLKYKIVVASEGFIKELWGPITELEKYTGWKYIESDK
jgi:hypothetical protein